MNQRVADILNYLDQDEQQASTSSSENVVDNASPESTTNFSSSQSTSTSSPSLPSSSPTDLSAFNDDKVYNKLSRQMKKKKYPMIYEGRVFNNEGEAQLFKQQVLASRRDYKRSLKQKKINESQMNFDAMPTLKDDSDEFDDLYEDDGYVYKKSKAPYAIVKNGVKKLIPKTSSKDAKKIYKSIEKTSGKEGIKHLVKAESEEDFKTKSDEAMNKVEDDDVKNSYYNHTHNDFASDSTWSQASFLKMMYQMMRENEELKSNAMKHQQEIQQVHKQIANPFRINPALMKK